MLKNEHGEPLQLTDPQLTVAYAKAHESRKKPATGTLFSLIAAFKSTTEFTKLGARTKKDYQRFLGWIEEKFGTYPLSLVEKVQTRGKFKTWRDELAVERGDRQADYAWGVLARVLSVAKDRGTIAANVCERGGKLYAVDRAEIIWTPDHIKAFIATASDELNFALALALWTGQRQGDLIKLTWHQYDGTHIRLRQGKRNARVAIPVGLCPALKAELDARRPAKPEGAILRNTRGEKWTGDGFRTSWGKAWDRAVGANPALDDGVRFNDLRGTAVTRLALAGCSVAQIAALTGHSLKDVDRILQAHYLGGKFELAEQAMAKLDKHVNGTP
ncbi:tyrosine-type recombinase/integrase [Bradyrhizobium pachyrhizi]|uniref:tyrosine-type recombinase/integrase n=1 Tax=Bradyrhizobium pachyrhizi TaxID=280333 RepID=UPI000ADF1C4F|nr:tyrosine-type recombinase/integrase [Bradyrhizobium pachyrhizi]